MGTSWWGSDEEGRDAHRHAGADDCIHKIHGLIANSGILTPDRADVALDQGADKRPEGDYGQTLRPLR